MHISQPSGKPAASPPVTQDPRFPALVAPRMGAVCELDAAVATCRACPRLVAWREEVAQVKGWSWARSWPNTIEPELAAAAAPELSSHDSSTTALIRRYRASRAERTDARGPPRAQCRPPGETAGR
jgi:hypothetical protein